MPCINVKKVIIYDDQKQTTLSYENLFNYTPCWTFREFILFHLIRKSFEIKQNAIKYDKTYEEREQKRAKRAKCFAKKEKKNSE